MLQSPCKPLSTHLDLLAWQAALLQPLAAMDNVMQITPEVLKRMVGEEAERAEIEADDGRDGALEQRARVQQHPIAAQADHKVYVQVQPAK